MLVSYGHLDLKHGWKNLFFIGISLLFLGLIAIIIPQVTTYTIQKLIGVFLLLGAILKLFYTTTLKGSSVFISKAVWGLIATLLGLYFLFSNEQGAKLLTFIMGFFFLFTGIVEFIFSFEAKNIFKPIYLIIHATIFTVLGAAIILHLAEFAPWVIGFLVGIDLLSMGLWVLLLSFSLKRIES